MLPTLYLFIFPLLWIHYGYDKPPTTFKKLIELLIALYFETGFGVPFIVLLPMGFLYLLVGHTNIISYTIVSVGFVVGLTYYLIKCKTMRLNLLLFSSLVIIIIFVLSMKGCVASLRDLKIHT